MSHPVAVQCPHCHSQGNLADDSLLGQSICCPMCQQIFVAPLTVTDLRSPPVASPAPVAEPGPVNEDADIPAPTVIDHASTSPPDVPGDSISADSTTKPDAGLEVPTSATLTVRPPDTESETCPGSPVSLPVAAASLETIVPGQQAAAVNSVAPPPVAGHIVWRFGAAPPESIETAPNAAPLAVGLLIPVATVPMAGISAAVQPSSDTIDRPAGALATPELYPGIPPLPPRSAPILEGPLPSFLAPPPLLGAAEVEFAQSLPEPDVRGSVPPPIPPSKLMQTVIVGSITVILLFATAMFLLGDPWRRWGKVRPPPEPDEMNPIARPFVPDPTDPM